MAHAKKTKKQIEHEIALTGTYAPSFNQGDKIVSDRTKNLNKVKNPNILEIKRVIYPLNGELPSYRMWSEKEGKHKSELCNIVDSKYRKMASLEAAVFLD